MAVLALILTGCIQPDAPYPGGSVGVGLNTPIFPPTAPGTDATPVLFPTGAPIVQTVPGVVPTAGAAPATTAGTVAPFPTAGPTVPIAQGSPEPAQFIWRFAPVGPEQVAVMFYLDSTTGARCIRYIYRSKNVQRCPQAGQTLVTVAGIESSADNRQYTIIAGRTLDSRINTVALEYRDGSSQPIQTGAGGYLLIIEGARQPIQAVPIDSGGNLVGAVVPVT